MKRLIIIIFALTIAASSEAQKIRGGRVYQRPRVVMAAPIYPGLGFGYGFGMGYRYSPFYSPFYDPFYRSPRYELEPKELQLQVEDIENEYDYRISTTRRDKSISGRERRQKIRDIKHGRDNAIIDAKRNYYKNESKRSN
ncbi:MAG: hypothetical protein JWQ96_936 [Segetibacter sp.]|nr:hypothetical protein [Segetibacter sp.]